MLIRSFYLAWVILSTLFTSTQKTPAYVFSTMPFDEEGTAKLLEQGTSTIRVNAFI